MTRADFFHIQRDSFELTKVPLQSFTYQAVKLPPGLEEAIRRSTTELTKPWLPDPSRLRSPLFPPGSGYPWGTRVSPELQLAVDLEAVRDERARTARATAGFAQGLDELAAMEARTGKERGSIGGLKQLEYHEHHKGLQAMAAWTTEALAQEEKLVADAATALDEEAKRSGTAGSTRRRSGAAPRPPARSSVEALRDEQLRLQAERQQLLATIAQVKDRAANLQKPLSDLKELVEHQAADLHNMALRAFEVALTASSGFWITLGLLASWSIRRQGGRDVA